jgi:ABC-2 type transport system ATP-binding protein
MNSAIEAHELVCRFGGNTAVDSLSLSVPEGSIYAFLGPNGAGKTTTIKMLMNIIRPTGGSAGVLGVDSTRLGPREFEQIGYVSENQKMPDWMTVQELIDFCRPMYPSWDPAFCAKLLAGFDLPLDRRLRSLSRGMRMKASLLTSLAYHPRLLVMDEPFTGLDPLVRDEVIRGLLELTGQEKWTIFISSHDIDEVERLADWVGVINAGKVHLAESAASLQQRFRTIECVVPKGCRLPAAISKAWLIVEMNEHSVQFVDSAYESGLSEARIAEVFPGSTDVTVSEMSLKDIFLALARTFRMKA